MDTFPDEVQAEIRRYEEYGRELVFIEHTGNDTFDNWEIVYFEPISQDKEMPYDKFWLANFYWYSWPTSEKMELATHFYAIERETMQAMLAFKSKQKPAGIEEVA
jgi:hypothetical protein